MSGYEIKIKSILENEMYMTIPEEVKSMFMETSAPPRLVAHLVIVHDVARKLIKRLRAAFPELKLDAEAILFGAATHDLGKTVHPRELSESGRLHQEAGVELLTSLGVPKERARFAWTHGHWQEPGQVQIEDLVVALADKCWKGKRIPELENALVERLASVSGQPQWQCFAVLDEIVGAIAADADSRLACVGSFPVE